MEKNESILKIRNLSLYHNKIKALDNINLEVKKGELLVLVGANGAGKTSLMETILGSNVPQHGEILFKENEIKGKSVDYIVRNGIYLVPEDKGVFSSMTVLDNLLLGAHNNRKDVPLKLETVYDFFPVLFDRQKQIAGTLSGGERRMLAIARALMSSPEIILIDEPSIGLAPIIVNNIFEIIKKLNNEGYTIILSEQNIYKALKIAQRGCVLETGKIVKYGCSKELLNDEAVKNAYLGV